MAGCFMTRMSRAFSPSFLGASFFDFAGHENLSEGGRRKGRKLVPLIPIVSLSLDI